MSNVMLKLSASKKELYRKQRVVGRLGDGNLTTIDIYLLQEDGYSPYILTGDMILTFKGNLANGEYTEGPIIIQDSQEGFCQYTFSRENFSAAKEYKRAYIELTDASGAVTTFQDFIIDVLPNADISRGQVQLYVSKLDTLLKEFSDTYSQFVLEKENEFQNFINEKEIQYQNIYDQYNELIRRLNESDQRMNSIETDQDRIIKLIEENDVFTKTESSANVIYQIIGKEEVELTFSLDLKGKIAGRDTENRNSYKYFNINNGTLPTTITGSELKNTGDWDDYSRVFDVDGKLFTTSAMVADRGVGHAAVWNLLQVVKDTLGNDFFSDQGATSISSQTALIRNRSCSLIASMWGYGSNPTGNKLTIKTLRTSDLVWAYEGYHTKDSVQKLTTVINPASIPYYISEDGFVTQCAFSDASDGSTASMARVDYATLEFKMKISMNEYIKNVIAAYSGENSVSLSEPQTVEGLKNFSDGVQSKGIDVATQDMTKVTLFQSTEISNVKGTASGIVWPIDETAIVFGGVGAHARRGGTSEPGTIYFNEAGQYLIELLWFVNSGTATRKYVYMDWIKHGTTDLLFRSGIGENNGFSYTSSVPGGGIITMGKDEGVDILLKTNVEDLIAGVKIYYIKISKIG